MDVVTGAMGNLAHKLQLLSADEYNLQPGVMRQLRFLSEEMESIYAALRKVAQVPPDQLDEQAKIWAREARETYYDLEDILDSFLLSESSKPDDQRSVLKKMSKLLVGFSPTTKARRDIQDINRRIQEVAARRVRYQIDAVVAKPAAESVDPRLSAIYTQASHLVGIDEPMHRLIEMLPIGDANTSSKKMKIISIVGVGGLGKTTLAKVVYDRVKHQFDFGAFVSVGRNPHLAKIFKDILYGLTKNKNPFEGEIDVQQLISKLREFHQEKRYFIVIDDIWDSMSWEIIKSALVDNNHGSVIITTTRNFEVAVVADVVYKLQPLSNDDSKQLFYLWIFGGEGTYLDYDRLDKVSDRFLKKCGGVPLAIITIASLLVGKPKERWSDEWDNLIGFGHNDNMQFGNMRRLLSVSYYDLPAHLRTCLLHLSVFPEDYVIKKDNLIWMWIAEGFVREEEGKGLFELGEGYFNSLLNRSLIQAVEFGLDGVVQGCCVHEIVLDFIYAMSHEENFVSILGEGSQMLPSGNVRRLALHNRNEELSLGNDMGLPHLRSFNAIGCPIYMIPPVSSFNILRVLYLESCGSILEGYNLEHLGKLRHLRFVGLRNTVVRKLPKEIRHLKFLQALELEGSRVEELPASMDELAGLICLKADWTTRVPDWIGKLTSLQQLVMYPGFGDDESSVSCFVNGVGRLRELRVLRFLIKTQREGQLIDVLKSLSDLKKVEVIQFDCYGEQLLNNTVVLSEPTDFAFSITLRVLELRWLEFSRLPSWINPEGFPNLCRLWLMVSDMEEQDLEILAGFPELLHLHLLIVNTEQGRIFTCSSGGFQKMKFCSITKPLKFQHGAMPSLEVLDFHFSVRLLTDASHNFNVEFGLGNLPSLQQVIVQINCLAASPEEVGKAVAAVSDAIDSHPNRPTLEISHKGQRKETLDADLIVNHPLQKTDEPREELIRMLSVVDNDASSKKMKILSIVRSEGLGKTTLAQEVFDMLIPQFDCGAFVQVGQNADLRKVLTDILIGLDKQDIPVTVLDLMELIGLLQKSLINKRFFVVVDDLWDLKAWDIIKCALIENSNGSAVLTTSCKTRVTEHIGGSMQLARLSATESTKIFCRKLFGSEDKCPPELEEICENIIKTCDGMLSKITEAVKQLESVPSKVKDWQAVYGGRKIYYGGLPDHLKSCILYFSMFPKGHEISAERIVWQWIAEGLVQTTQEHTLQEVGEKYLSNFIMEKMIEAVEVDAGGKALSCRVHDFVHDIVVKKSREDNLVAILDGPPTNGLTDTVHRWLSIQGNTVVDSLPKAWLSQVRSLVVSGDIMPPLSDFRHLHAVDLGGSLLNDHLKGIHNSHSLRYMAIGSKCITSIPKEITFMKLKNLQTLDLRESGLNEVPKKIFRLVNLERLCVNSHMTIPDGIAKMSALQELGDINITNKSELLKEIHKLNKLRVLRIAIWSWDDENLKSSGKQLWNNLCSLVQSRQRIKSLSILTCCSLEFMDKSVENWPPQCLQNLEIRYSAFDKLPSWFELLPKISSLTIEVWKLSLEIIETLGKLPTLVFLSLTSKQTPEAYFFIDSDAFKNLASLKFASNAMAQNMLAPQKATQQLKRLTIVFQASRTGAINKDFSFGLENLSFLEHVRVEIICFNASHQMVNDAEAAIREAVSRDRSSHPNLEIRRLEEENMIAEVEPCDTEQEQKKTKRCQNKNSSSKKIGVTGKLFRQKRRKELLEHITPFLDSTAKQNSVPSQAP